MTFLLHLVLQVREVCQVHQGWKERTVYQAVMVSMVVMDSQEIEVVLEPRASLEIPDNLVRQVQMGMTVRMEDQAIQVNPEHRDK